MKTPMQTLREALGALDALPHPMDNDGMEAVNAATDALISAARAVCESDADAAIEALHQRVAGVHVSEHDRDTAPEPLPLPIPIPPGMVVESTSAPLTVERAEAMERAESNFMAEYDFNEEGDK